MKLVCIANSTYWSLVIVSLLLAREAILSCTSGSVIFTAPDKKPKYAKVLVTSLNDTIITIISNIILLLSWLAKNSSR